MLKRIGISAFLLGISISQAFAEGHSVAGGHGETTHAEVDAHGAVTHGAAEHASSGGLPQLDPSSYSSQLFWLVIVFVFMFIFFSKKTVPQYSRTIENRAERITGDLDSADRLKSEIAELQQSYEEKLVEAREESYTVFMNSEKEIKEDADRKTADFQERSRKKIEELEANIEEARDAAMKEMSDVAAEVATQASEKIIGVKIDKKTAKAVVKSVSKAA